MPRKVFVCLSCGHTDTEVNGKTEHTYDFVKDANGERQDVVQHLDDYPSHFITEVVTGDG